MDIKNTLRHYRELHREQWFWCGDNPDKFISEWPRLEKNGGDIESPGVADCFACSAANLLARNYGWFCNHCPIKNWGNGVVRCFQKGSYLMLWTNPRNPHADKKLAYAIAEAWPEVE